MRQKVLSRASRSGASAGWASPINDLPEGYYVLMNCECKPELPAELDRVFKITDGILRSIIVAVEA